MAGHFRNKGTIKVAHKGHLAFEKVFWAWMKHMVGQFQHQLLVFSDIPGRACRCPKGTPTDFVRFPPDVVGC